MKRVLILSQFFPPETAAGAKRIDALATAMVGKIDVTVLTLDPSYPSKDIFRGIDWESADRIRDFRVVRPFGFKPHYKSYYVRAIKELWFSIRLGAVALGQKFDALIVTTPSMFLGPVGRIVGRLKNAAVVWDVRDITWKYGSENVRKNSVIGYLAILLNHVMSFSLKRVDLVVCATDGISKNLLAESRILSENIRTIPNGVSGQFVNNFQRSETARKILKRVTYIGLIGHNQGISVLVEVARRLPDIEFVVIGDGAERKKIVDALETAGIKNFTLLPYIVDSNKLKTVYDESHILFAQIVDRPTLNETAMSSKLLEYMATGRPIVYAGKGMAVERLTTIGCAEISRPEDPEAIVAAINRLTVDPERAHAMGNCGRDHVLNNFHRETLMSSYVEIIDELLETIQ